MIDSGSSRTPVAIADSPSATDRNSGTTKNRPACRRYWKKNDDEPAAQRPVPQHRRIDQRGSRRARAGGSPTTGRPTARPRRRGSARSPATARATAGAPGLGWTKPHVPERRMPNTTSPRPSADSTVPTRSSRAPCSAGVSAIRRVSARMTSTTSTSPTNTHRHDRYVVNRPPISGPAATAIAPADATSPYARGRSVAGEVRRDQRDDRRHDQRRADAFEDRPARGSARRGSARARW